MYANPFAARTSARLARSWRGPARGVPRRHHYIGPGMEDDTDQSDPAERRGAGARARLSANVIALSAVSFFTDLSSELIYPLLPLFLTTTLGATAAAIGLIEGAAEATAALLKLASGWWSDRVERRKPLVVAGYAIASVVRPLVAVAAGAGQVLAIRVADRVGKGIRTSPRDALLADSVDAAARGRAFGFHRAADHAGAVVGPLVAFALLQWGGLSLRAVFALAAVPAAVAMIILVWRVREPPHGARAGATPQLQDRARSSAARHPGSAASIVSLPPAHDVALPPRFWGFLGAVALFTLGNSTDAFLLLRASQLGVAPALIPVLWAALHLVKSASSTPGGALSDRVGRRPLIVAGWLVYALVYLGFAAADATWHVWALFGAYGLFFGLTEGAEKALVTDLVGADVRGRAFGWYNLVVGIAALPASLGFGMLWDRGGPRLAFTVGAGFALAATVAIACARSSAAESRAPAASA
jgi:MFS family permease